MEVNISNKHKGSKKYLNRNASFNLSDGIYAVDNTGRIVLMNGNTVVGQLVVTVPEESGI